MVVGCLFVVCLFEFILFLVFVLVVFVECVGVFVGVFNVVFGFDVVGVG